MSTGVQPSTKQLISQNAYIVQSKWPSSNPLSLTSKTGNDKYFLRHRCHFRCRKGLHTDLLSQAYQCRRLLLFRCSVGTHSRSWTFLLLHRNLVRGRGHHRGKGSTPARFHSKTRQCSDVCYDCGASLLDYDIFSQVLLPFLLPGSCQPIV